MKLISNFNIKKSFNDNSFRRMIRNSGALLIGDTGSSLVNVLVLVMVIKIIGAENYGVIVLIQTYSITFDQLINFQSWQALIKYGAEDIENNYKSKFSQLIKLGTLLDFSTALLSLFAAYFAAEYIGALLGWNSDIISFAKLYSISILFHFSGVPVGVLKLFNQFYLISIQKITVSIIKLLGILIIFIMNYDFLQVLWLFFIADVFGHLFLIVAAFFILIKNKYETWWKEKFVIRKDFLTYSIWTNLSSMITVPSKQIDVFIVSAVLSIEMVGVYKVFKQLASLLSRLATPIYQSVFPEFANEIAKNNIKKALMMCVKVSVLLAVIILPLIILFGLSSKFWLEIFFGKVISEHWINFFVFSIFVGLDSITSSIHPLFNVMGYVKQKFLIMAGGNVLYLLLAWLLGNKLSLTGIIIAWGLQFIFITITKVYYMKYKMHLSEVI